MPAFTIAKREFRSYFTSPLAYVVICAAQVILGALFFHYKGGFFQINRSSMTRLFQFAPYGLTLLVVPVITMGTLAQEKASGTLEMLITLPVKDWEVIVGKYLGAMGLVSVLIASTIVYPVVIFEVFDLGVLDWGPVATGYLGLFLLAASAVAVGLLVSSTTRSQVIAFFITFLVLVSLSLLNGMGSLLSSAKTGNIIKFFSFQHHMEMFARGLIDSRSVIYFLSVTIFALMAAFRSLEARRYA